MSQKQGQYQVQTEAQLLRLSPQQLLVSELIQLPVGDLEERVKNEVIDNIALEERSGNNEGFEAESSDEMENPLDDYNTNSNDKEENESSSDTADYATDDEIPVHIANKRDSEGAEIPIGESRSFIDELHDQIGEFSLNDHERTLMEYLIGSLNKNGYVDKSLTLLADELSIYNNVDTTTEELESILSVLQEFEPAGIGARNLQECLLIQIRRKYKEKDLSDNLSKALHKAEILIENHYDFWRNQDEEKIEEATGWNKNEIASVMKAISRFNPYPGLSLHESSVDRVQTIIPDFIVETEGDNYINFTLNDGEVPVLHINKEYETQLDYYIKKGENLSRGEKEAFLYTKQKVESARIFIESLKQRQRTLRSTMKAIIELQRAYFFTQDSEDLNPLVLRDVAKKANLDISTVSRVCSSKYALVDGIIHPLSDFFFHLRKNSEGEMVEANKVIKMLEDIIANEDKTAPLSDEQLAEKLKSNGLSLSRRTVAKYRKDMGIPVAKNRLADYGNSNILNSTETI